MTISGLPSIYNGLIDCTAAYCNVKFEAKSIQLHNWYMTAILAKKLKLYHKETQETITEKVFFCFAFSPLKREIKFPPIWLLDFFYLFNCLLDRMKCENFSNFLLFQIGFKQMKVSICLKNAKVMALETIVINIHLIK